MERSHLALGLMLCLLAAGCATTREQRAAGAWLEERQAWFDAHPAWSISGRVGLSDGERGGSLAFAWQAEGETHQIDLRTGAGGQRWRLDFTPEQAVLVGSGVDRLSGPDPDPLVEQAVGWPIPVDALSWWIRGLLPPGGGFMQFAEDGSLAAATDPPWQLDYRRFAQIHGHFFPTRLDARSGPYEVRIVIRDWRFVAEVD